MMDYAMDDEIQLARVSAGGQPVGTARGGKQQPAASNPASGPLHARGSHLTAARAVFPDTFRTPAQI